MKLTEEQKIIRTLFRVKIVEYWNTDKSLMFGIIDYICDGYPELTREQVKDKMAEIPSIGRFREKMPIHAFVARYFRPVSDAMFNGCTAEHALELWSKTKRNTAPEAKRTKEEMQEYQKTKRDFRNLGAIAELHKNMPDRYEKSNWHKCK